MRVALIQMDVQIGEPDVNLDRLMDRLQEAVALTPKPDVLVCPEMWNTGYALDRLDGISDVNGLRTKNTIAAFCRKHQVSVIAGSVAVQDAVTGQASNTLYGFDREGNGLVEYSKIHLFQLMDEHLHLTAGEHVASCQLEGMQAGMLICYDIRFPELARKLVLDGAEVLFVVAQWPNPRMDHWRTLLRARAIENQVYVVACNRVGESEGTSFFGQSMVIDPWGEVLAEAEDQEQILVADIDKATVESIRKKIPIFDDRRPTLY
jgi:predicted amidohydrolase